MALSHTPLDSGTLSPEAQRALAPGPARMMAARGLAPMANPADLVTVLYQLAVDPDANVAQAARTSAAGLPDHLLDVALADAELDARVLDYFSGILDASKTGLAERIVLNRSTADATIADVAKRASSQLVDLIVQNEQRLLRDPSIIAAIYQNRSARMSTVDRAVELAIRNNVKVPDIPA